MHAAFDARPDRKIQEAVDGCQDDPHPPPAPPPPFLCLPSKFCTPSLLPGSHPLFISLTILLLLSRRRGLTDGFKTRSISKSDSCAPSQSSCIMRRQLCCIGVHSMWVKTQREIRKSSLRSHSLRIMGRDFFGTQSPSISTLNNHLTINIFERYNHEDWDHWTEVLRVGKT